MTYNVKHTDTNKTPISVNEGEELTTGTDISLFGRIYREYGEELNENLLHILENFACPESPVLENTPDYSLAYTDLLEEPVEGQFWYNSTQKAIFVWDGTVWKPLGMRGDVAANWGRICHGEQLPQPVSPTTGYVFPYEECIWSVAPASYVQKYDYMACSTDVNANVTMQYQLDGTSTLVDGIANYLIIGIRGNSNNGTLVTPPPLASPTPTPILSPTPTPTVSDTPSATVTPTPTVTPSETPPPGVSVTPTPTVTPTRTGTPAPTVTASPSVTVTPSVTPSSTQIVTPTPTPTVTPSTSAIPPSISASTATLTASCFATMGLAGNGHNGVSCTGAPGVCDIDECGPESPSLQATISGGVGPYTITVEADGSLPGECFTLGYNTPGATTSVFAGSAGYTQIFSNSYASTGVKTIGIIVGRCAANDPGLLSGTFRITVTDANLNTDIEIINWQFLRAGE